MKIHIKHEKDQYFIGSARMHQNITIDEPESFHGTNKGASPVEYLLISIGSCLGSTLVYCLKRKEVQFKDLTIEVDCKLSHSGPKRQLRIVSIIIYLSIHIIEDKFENFDECTNSLLEYCIVSNVIKEDIKFELKIKKKY